MRKLQNKLNKNRYHYNCSYVIWLSILFKYHQRKREIKKRRYFIFCSLKEKTSKLLCFLTFTQQLKRLNSNERYRSGTTQETTVLGSRTVHKPCRQGYTQEKESMVVRLLRWWPQLQTCALLFRPMFQCRPLDSSYLQPCERKTRFSSLAGEKIPYCSYIRSHPWKNSQRMVYAWLLGWGVGCGAGNQYICKKSIISESRIGQEWARAGRGRSSRRCSDP